MGECIYLSQTYIGQSHSECIRKTDSSVFLVDEVRDVKIPIIDKDGNICNFPGIAPCDALCAEMDTDHIRPKVTYSASFEKCPDGQFRMIWTVRPDGRYWMDSWGFGAEDYDWVELYSHIDKNGQFTAPFRLYSIGYKKFVQP